MTDEMCKILEKMQATQEKIDFLMDEYQRLCNEFYLLDDDRHKKIMEVK